MLSDTQAVEVREKVCSIVRGCREPVSIDYVAHHIGFTWQTTRAILLELALAGKIRARKTTKSWIFEPNSEEVNRLTEPLPFRKK